MKKLIKRPAKRKTGPRSLKRMVRRRLLKWLKIAAMKCDSEGLKADDKGEVALSDELWAAASHLNTARERLKEALRRESL